MKAPHGMDDFDEESPKDKKRPVTEEDTPEPSESNTLHIPTGFLQGTEFKAGDKVMLKVVAVGDGGIEVAYATEDEVEGEDEMVSADAELDAINDGY